MIEKIISILRDCETEFNNPATDQEIAVLLAAHPNTPSELIALLRFSNSLGAWVGENYISINGAETIVEMSDRDKGFGEFYPTFLVFGSDGGNMGFAYDFALPGVPIVDFDFVGDPGDPLAPNLIAFFELMKTTDVNLLTGELRNKRHTESDT